MPSHTVTASDGVRIAVHDLGGSGPPLLLVHPTGFHGRALLPLASYLSPRFHVVAYDARGHGESGLPPALDFDPQGFTLDARAVVEGLDLRHPVGVGHSGGGSALLLAEQARPGTFSSLYCYEPIVTPAEQPPPPDPDNPFSRGARGRREVFASRQDAYENYAGKPPLDALDPDSLRAYVEFGFEDLSDGTVRLRCRGAHEALMYEKGLSHDAFAHLPEISCPTTLACGELTDAIGPAVLEPLAARLPGARVEVFPDLGHFGPLEDPRRVAVSVLRAAGWARGSEAGAEQDLDRQGC